MSDPHASRIDFYAKPFHVWRAYPRVMPGPHVHTDIELNLLLSGGARYFLAGRFYDIPAARLAVFWAGMPHRMTAVEPETEYICATLPLGWFLGWGIAGGLRDRLLAGELVTASDAAGIGDGVLFRSWACDLANGGSEERRIVQLEMEARLRRLAREISDRGTLPGIETEAEGRYVETMAAVIGEKYAEPLAIAQIAAAAGLHPNYAMTIFRQGCGLSIHEYLTRLRISHAQRLLMTTRWTVERIALECGFGSASRFFAAFKERCACTPREYRSQK